MGGGRLPRNNRSLLYSEKRVNQCRCVPEWPLHYALLSTWNRSGYTGKSKKTSRRAALKAGVLKEEGKALFSDKALPREH